MSYEQCARFWTIADFGHKYLWKLTGTDEAVNK